MNKDRLLAFSDGVIAIIITIMVLDLHPPREPTLEALGAVAPVFLSYVLSFLYVAIYWNNHHHLLYTAERVNGAILWANTHLLFWLSLIPFTTQWMGQTGGAKWPTIVYGLSLLAPGVAFYILQTLIVREHGRDHILRRALGFDWKGVGSPLFYVFGVIAGFFDPRLAQGVFVAVALIWLAPDPRIERVLKERGRGVPKSGAEADPETPPETPPKTDEEKSTGPEIARES